jgi:hypothetical protein
MARKNSGVIVKLENGTTGTIPYKLIQELKEQTPPGKIPVQTLTGLQFIEKAKLIRIGFFD